MARKPLWRFSNLRTGDLWDEIELTAHWEVSGDPMSDDYRPDEISAHDLFRKWASRAQDEYQNGLLPIHWFIAAEGPHRKTFEALPFRFEHGTPSRRDDFLGFFTWPEGTRTGEALRWSSLPVIDKLWRRGRADKGGFIQEFTGWKPSVYQPFVYLPSLVRAVTQS